MNKQHTSIDLPPISSYPSRKEWEAACWRRISRSQDLLELIITPHERHDLVMRTAALQRILSGKSYRQIGEELWLSSQTISVIKKALNENNYRSYHERGKKERKKRQYSSISRLSARPRGRRVRTKYGTIYLPYMS
ncbi:MAG: Trp family transcriptional regulator [Patescibacteria group bacterium]